jgi:hypothetical protein
MAYPRRFLLYLLAAGLLETVMLGQAGTGAIKGSLEDESGAIVPAITVTLTGGGTTKTAQSQADGTYSFIGLAPGQYTAKVTLSGFAPFSSTVTVASGATVQLPIRLAVQLEAQEVTVSADSRTTVSVEPENNATALVITGQDLQALPDDPDDLSSALQALAGPGAGPNGGQIYVDGFSGGQLPPKETIREVRINQNPFSAEYDRLGFGRIEILTKPGTGVFHGMLFFNYSNGIFDSRNPFASNKPEYSNRMYGGNMSGPIGKRASFFLDYNERDITNNAITNAIFLNPVTLLPQRINTAVVTPQANRTIAPRIDYQINANNTLTARVEERMSFFNNAGLGGYNLPPPDSFLAYDTSGDSQNVMVTETAVLSSRAENETRFQYYRNFTRSLGNEIPQVDVANSFVTGGNGVGNTFDRTHHYELQNYTSLTRGTHTIRVGGRVRRDSDQNNNPQGFNGQFVFLGGVLPVLNGANQIVFDENGNVVTALLTSIQQYQRNLTLQMAGFTPAQIQVLGGGPSRFNIQAGIPYVSMVRYDAAPFVQDDWRVRPNLTISMGLRYEVQNLVQNYNDWAPRLGFAWAPGKNKKGPQKTVIRGGAGIFYDRVSLTPFEQAALYNGHTQMSFTVYNPPFFLSDIPPTSSLSPGQNAIYLVDPNLQADYSIQSAIGVERQLPPRNTTASLTYTYTHGEHYLQTVPINAPLPGTFNPLLPLGPENGVFPFGFQAGNIFEYQSGGILRQRILMATINTRFSKRVSVYANYQLTYANDLPSIPTNPYNFRQDYGRSNLDRRNNFQLFGSIQAPAGIWISPFIILRSGAPYDVLAGVDLYGTTLENARAAFAPGICPAGFSGTIGNVVCSTAGAFTSSYNPANPINLVPRNFLTMTPLISVNLRIYHVFGIGRVMANATTGAPGGGGGGGRGSGGGAMSMGSSGGGRGSGGGATDHRFNLTIGLNVTNLPNHFNGAGFQGVITSPQFLQPTTVNTGFGGGGVGGGGGGTANNRRIEFDSRFTF